MIGRDPTQNGAFVVDTDISHCAIAKRGMAAEELQQAYDALASLES